MAKQKDKQKRRPSRVLMYMYIICLCLSLVIIGRIIYLQYIWEPNPDLVSHFLPSKQLEIIQPRRGSIIDCNGKLLAISTPKYNIFMDTYVQKEHNDNNFKTGERDEMEWIAKAGLLSKGLSEHLSDSTSTGHKKDSTYYMNLILEGRKNKRKYVNIAKNVDYVTFMKIKELPLFNEPSHKGGLRAEELDNRLYPYGSLARRAIGYVKGNNDSTTRSIGIEGKYNHMLHGREGAAWEKRTDNFDWIYDIDSTYVSAEDGVDIRMTIDIDIQAIADQALRNNLEGKDHIEKACAIVMDVNTGAVKAMVNFQRDSSGNLNEVYNFATSYASESGSVMKTLLLATLLEDGHVKISDKLPTNHGVLKIGRAFRETDEAIIRHEKRTGEDEISIRKGLEISSNYVFRSLIYKYYGNKIQEYTDRLHLYNMGSSFNFELVEPNSPRPTIPDPYSMRTSDIVSAAIGYNIKTTPLQITAFYNAIANGGRLYKPYIVDAVERDGYLIEKNNPVVLNTIMSKETTDSLKVALGDVVNGKNGTASILKKAKCSVVGKTGTALMYMENNETGLERGGYTDADGRKKHQGSFVGFFPADNPTYTAMVVTYSYKLKGTQSGYGGSIPAGTVKDIVDGIWAIEKGWRGTVECNGDIPAMENDINSYVEIVDGVMPDLTGMGLKDVIILTENNGYSCIHSGKGHVKKQTPAVGAEIEKGDTITIVLE